MKKLIALLLALLLTLGLVACSEPEPPAAPEVPQTPEEPEAPAETEIDIYLIAGQSNAAGTTNVINAQSIYSFSPELRDGFSHVLYAGNARTDNGTNVINNATDWISPRIGLGSTSSKQRIGPEAGMAAALAEHYNAESGKYAGIIKMAHGGTSLLISSSGSNKFGNWVPPSYAAGKGIDWENDPVNGALYREFLATVGDRIEKLSEHEIGFTKINIKGIYWMQGCNNRNNPSEYRRAFEFFARDIRADLAALLTEICGSDCGAADMPIFVGTISATFGLVDANTQANINEPFITMQKKLPNRVENCYVVDNSGYEMGYWNSSTNSLVVTGSDKHHWNQEDMLEIGYNVGEMMYETNINSGG